MTSLEETNEGCCSFLSVGIIFFFDSPHQVQNFSTKFKKDAEFNAACSLFMYTTYEKTSRFIKGTWISTNKNNFIHG